MSKNYAFYIGECDFDRTMIDLAEGLGCWPPEIIKNPPKHLLSELAEVVDYPVVPDTGRDLLSSTRQRLQDAAVTWERNGGSESRSQLALISGKDQEPSEPTATLSDAEREARAWSAILDGNELGDEAENLSGEARAEKLDIAEEELRAAKALSSKAGYNLACLHSLRGNVNDALDELEACLKDGTLPLIKHLEADTDMDPLRNEPRFKALLEKAA